MPGIWNVGNGYNVNSKKVSRKLTFESGEQFTGRVVAKGDGKDVTIKLSDGWQFIAEVEGNVNTEDLKLVKFEVEGFDNGKLKLKLISSSGVKGQEASDENFDAVVEKEGLSKEDIDTLKLMVKYRIPLSKENITRTKGLIQLSSRMSSNENYIKDFIENYISEKGISADSIQADFIRNELGKFLEAFKGMTSDEILTFLENNIEFNKENIDSFNKLFMGDSSVEKLIENLGKVLEKTGIDEGVLNYKEDILNNIEENSNKFENSNLSKDNLNALTKLYGNNDKTSKNLNMMELLKTISSNSEDESKSAIGKDGSSLLNRLNDNELMILFKDAEYDDSAITNTSNKDLSSVNENNKQEFERILSKVEGKTVKLSDDQFKKINTLFENKVREEHGLKQVTIKTDFDNKNNKILDDVLRNTLNNKDAVKSEMKGKIEGVKEIVKNLIAVSSLQDEGYDKVINLIKDNINNFKVFNSVSDEYYCLNFPVNMQSQEYPCKLIIKDNRKDGKKIDTTNAKMVVSVKTVHMGEVDGYLTIKDKKINVNLKCDSDFTSILNDNKVKLSDGLRTLGLFVNITVSEKEKPVDLVNCRDFFNDTSISTIDIKV